MCLVVWPPWSIDQNGEMKAKTYLRCRANNQHQERVERGQVTASRENVLLICIVFKLILAVFCEKELKCLS